MFAIPIFGLRAANIKTPVWLKVVATSGLLMTLLYVALSVVPIINVESPWLFASKIGGLIIIMNVIGVAIYLFSKRGFGRQMV